MTDLMEEPRNWTKWVACECADNDSFQRVLETALLRFQNIVLSDTSTSTSSTSTSTSTSTSINFGYSLGTTKVLARGLSRTSTLTRLELRETSLNSEQMACLATGLKRTNTLETLRFGAIRFADTRAVAQLGRALEVITHSVHYKLYAVL
jgi:hypothetical protein